MTSLWRWSGPNTGRTDMTHEKHGSSGVPPGKTKTNNPDAQGPMGVQEQRYARIVAATGIKPDYLPAWCDERERETAVLRELTYPYWTVKDPTGHLVHTVLACDKDDAIREWLKTEQAVNWFANVLRVAKGGKATCAQSWEVFEAEGYSIVRVDILEVPSVEQEGNEVL